MISGNRSSRRLALAIVLPLVGLLSCSKSSECDTPLQSTPATVRRITGPDELQQDKMVELYLEVNIPDSLCVQGLEGVIVDTSQNYIQVGADLVHTGMRKDAECNCVQDSTAYTVIYFTAEAPGQYVFSTRKRSVINASPDDSLTYRALIR